jgi:predicted DNA-binding transcriptional regulator AlpA
VSEKDNPAQVLTQREVAELLGVHKATLRRMSDGPPQLRISKGRIGYRRSDLLAWQRARISPAPPPEEEAAA